MPKRDPILAAFGLSLRRWRETKNLTQERLAERADLDQTYISGIERGLRNPGNQERRQARPGPGYPHRQTVGGSGLMAYRRSLNSTPASRKPAPPGREATPLSEAAARTGVRQPFTCLDLFCGCGGFSLGMRRAGFQILAAIDSNEEAIQTYKVNIPRRGRAAQRPHPLHARPTRGQTASESGGRDCRRPSVPGLQHRASGGCRQSRLARAPRQTPLSLSPVSRLRVLLPPKGLRDGERPRHPERSQRQILHPCPSRGPPTRLPRPRAA